MKYFLLSLCATLPLLAADSFVIRNITVHPVTSPDIANASVLVEDGKIVEVGVKVTVPKGAKVIDGKGLHVYPGMIDSATELGLGEIGSVRETSDTGELGDFNPQLHALVAINPASEHIPVVRANGITSAMALPFIPGGGGGRFGGPPPSLITGQPAMIHLDGWTWEDMAVKKSTAVELVFPTINTGGGRRGGAEDSPFAPPRTPYADAKRAYDRRMRDLNAFFENARRYQISKAAGASGLKADLKYEAMIPVLEGKMPLMITAVRERAIHDAIAFGDKQKIRIVIAGGREFGKTLAELKAKNIPVIAGPTLALPLQEDDPYDSAFTLPGELYKAGVKFAFGSFGNQFSRNLPYQAGTAVAFGLPYEEALKAVTINAAEIWGVADQIGSIEKGKWADLMITDGDPLETKTQVKRLFIKGKDVDLANKHTRLYEKYMNRP
jgi:imidazolonepropionase-like amidohydrolase